MHPGKLRRQSLIKVVFISEFMLHSYSEYLITSIQNIRIHFMCIDSLFLTDSLLNSKLIKMATITTINNGPPIPKRANAQNCAVLIQNLFKSYKNGSPVLKDFSMSIEKGDMCEKIFVQIF